MPTPFKIIAVHETSKHKGSIYVREMDNDYIVAQYRGRSCVDTKCGHNYVTRAVLHKTEPWSYVMHTALKFAMELEIQCNVDVTDDTRRDQEISAGDHYYGAVQHNDIDYYLQVYMQLCIREWNIQFEEGEELL